MTEGHLSELNLIKLRQAHWELSGGKDPLRGNSFQQLYNKSSSAEAAFNTGALPEIVCIDEGVSKGTRNRIAVAGSGILAEGIELLLDGKVSAVTSHEHCGAAALYARQHSIEGNSDQVGDKFARSLAEKLNVPYIGRIPAKNMTRPPEIHPARVVYYDGTARGFRSEMIGGFPLGFLVSRGYIADPQLGTHDADLAVQIALGSHGFGRLFSEQTPLYMVGITDNKKSSVPVEQLQEELKSIAKNYEAVQVETLLVK